MMQNTAPLYP
jgi:hypothetical protein